MNKPVVIDLETKYTFKKYKDPAKLGITVVGVYDYTNQVLNAYYEDELPKLYAILEHASYIIGFNINEFDLPVLQGYYPGKVTQFNTLDILKEIKDKLGRRLSLNDIAYATLGKKKSGHGLQAVDFYKKKEFEKLKRYCLDDVDLTKQIFEYGIENGKIHYQSSTGRQSIRVNWKKYFNSSNLSSSMSLTLPF